MAWQDDMVEILRVMIGDIDTTPTYTDAKLERVLVVSAFSVAHELSFDSTYSISIANSTLSPDPTLTETKEDSFVNLTCLNAACMMDRGGAIVAAQRAISVRDGGSAVDLRGVFQSKLALLEKGYCAVYDQVKFEHRSGQSLTGAIIMTPYRKWAGVVGDMVNDYYGDNFDGDTR